MKLLNEFIEKKKAQEYSKTFLARKYFGMSPQELHYYCKCDPKRCKIETLVSIANVIGIDYTDLLKGG